MLTDLELDSIRAAGVRALPGTATVRRASTVSDGGGGTTTTWADVATVACRIAPAGGGEGATAGERTVDESTHVVTLPAGTDVTEADRLLVGGQLLAVTLVHKRGAWEVARRVETKEIAS